MRLAGWLSATLAVCLFAKPPLYYVDIVDANIHPHIEPEDVREWVQIADHSGKRYNCSLPSLTAARPKRQLTTAERLTPIERHCLLRNEGWWRYELCWPFHVRQFHVEGAERVVEHLLGVSPNQSPEIVSYAQPPPALGMQPPLAFATQFPHGSVCDVSGARRSATVVFICAPSETRSVLSAVREPSPCVYNIEVSTSLICDESSLPHNAQNSRELPITCKTLPDHESDLSEYGGESVDFENEIQMCLDSRIPRRGWTMRHKIHGYRGLIAASDSGCYQSKEWKERMNVRKLKRKHLQPFYYVFVDERDRPGNQITYVPEESIDLKCLNEPVQHSLTLALFTGPNEHGSYELLHGQNFSFAIPPHQTESILQKIGPGAMMHEIVAVASQVRFEDAP